MLQSPPTFCRTERSRMPTPSSRPRSTSRPDAVGRAHKERTTVGKKKKNQVKDEALTDEELEQEDGEELPDREAMSLINANLAAPINAAVAANVLSDNSTAWANAEQTAPITQQN